MKFHMLSLPSLVLLPFVRKGKKSQVSQIWRITLIWLTMRSCHFNGCEQLLVASEFLNDLLAFHHIHLSNLECLLCVGYGADTGDVTGHCAVAFSALKRWEENRTLRVEKVALTSLLGGYCVCVLFLLYLTVFIVPHRPLLHTSRLWQSRFRNLLVDTEV